MSAIEDARAALAQYDRASIHTVLTTVPAVAQTLREMIAEAERLTAPPADDEREALAVVIHQAHHDGCNEYTLEDGAYADAILAAGFHRQWQITDAQVKAALEFVPLYPPTSNDWTASQYAEMRAALEAARDA
jgi:hypothetical protein